MGDTSGLSTAPLQPGLRTARNAALRFRLPGSYGAGLARFLASHGQQVLEVNRPDRQARRRRGKSDPIDADAAARAVQAGEATGTPKTQDGTVEMVRSLRVARQSAVKARTQVINALKGLLVTAPTELRQQLEGLSTARLIRQAAALDPRTPGHPDRGGHARPPRPRPSATSTWIPRSLSSPAPSIRYRCRRSRRSPQGQGLGKCGLSLSRW